MARPTTLAGAAALLLALAAPAGAQSPEVAKARRKAAKTAAKTALAWLADRNENRLFKKGTINQNRDSLRPKAVAIAFMGPYVPKAFRQSLRGESPEYVVCPRGSSSPRWNGDPVATGKRSRLVRVIAHRDAVSVTAVVTYISGSGRAEERPLHTVWVKEGKRYVVSVRSGGVPLPNGQRRYEGPVAGERIGPEEYQRDRLTATAFAILAEQELGGGGTTASAVANLHGKEVADIGEVIDVTRRGEQIAVIVRSSFLYVTVSCPAEGADALLQLEAGDVVEFAGKVTRLAIEETPPEGQEPQLWRLSEYEAPQASDMVRWKCIPVALAEGEVRALDE